MRAILAVAAERGFGLGLLLSSFGFGFRHGIDWDHIAALTDIASSQETPRKGLFFGTLYAAGHGLVVFAIGIIAIVAGEKLPESIDEAMGKVVGVTLVLLGIYVLYALVRYRRDFRMRSRWMLVFALLRRAVSWVSSLRHRRHSHEVEHEHEHATVVGYVHHDPHDEAPNGEAPAKGTVVLKTRTHTHGHKHRMPSDPFMNYGTGTSLLVGMLHGVGAETPTQVLIFLAAAGAGGPSAGVTVLGVFLVGLFAANSVITLSASYGFLAAQRQFAIYATVSVVTGVVSLVIGSLFLAGQETFLPALFGG